MYFKSVEIVAFIVLNNRPLKLFRNITDSCRLFEQLLFDHSIQRVAGALVPIFINIFERVKFCFYYLKILHKFVFIIFLVFLYYAYSKTFQHLASTSYSLFSKTFQSEFYCTGFSVKYVASPEPKKTFTKVMFHPNAAAAQHVIYFDHQNYISGCIYYTCIKYILFNITKLWCSNSSNNFMIHKGDNT